MRRVHQAHSPTPNPISAKITFSDTISVTYAFSADGTTISRKVEWTGGPAGGASGRGYFPNGSTITFTPNSPPTITNASICHYDYSKNSNKARSSSTLTLLLVAHSTLENAVFLRALSIK